MSLEPRGLGLHMSMTACLVELSSSNESTTYRSWSITFGPYDPSNRIPSSENTAIPREYGAIVSTLLSPVSIQCASAAMKR